MCVCFIVMERQPHNALEASNTNLGQARHYHRYSIFNDTFGPAFSSQTSSGSIPLE